MVISPIQACDMEYGLIQCPLPKPELRISELDGLNLNVTVPLLSKELPPEGTLPVFMFVHGGGYASGSSSWPQYGQARLVKLSSDMGIPAIGVGIK
jgi:carboxylesterase type B